MRKQNSKEDTRSEREPVKALYLTAAGHFQAARDDRDGRSRYRATKMLFISELGWYRDLARPYPGDGYIFL